MNAEKIIFEMRERLLSMRGRYGAVAEKSGLSVSWLSKFATGVKDDPKLKTLVALDSALDEMERSEDAHRTEERAA